MDIIHPIIHKEGYKSFPGLICSNARYWVKQEKPELVDWIRRANKIV